MGWFDDNHWAGDGAEEGLDYMAYSADAHRNYDGHFEAGTRKCSRCNKYKTKKDFNKEQAKKSAARRICNDCGAPLPTNLSDLSVTGLKAELERRGLSVLGKKGELVERLAAVVSNALAPNVSSARPPTRAAAQPATQVGVAASPNRRTGQGVPVVTRAPQAPGITATVRGGLPMPGFFTPMMAAAASQAARRSPGQAAVEGKAQAAQAAAMNPMMQQMMMMRMMMMQHRGMGMIPCHQTMPANVAGAANVAVAAAPRNIKRGTAATKAAAKAAAKEAAAAAATSIAVTQTVTSTPAPAPNKTKTTSDAISKPGALPPEPRQSVTRVAIPNASAATEGTTVAMPDGSTSTATTTRSGRAVRAPKRRAADLESDDNEPSVAKQHDGEGQLGDAAKRDKCAKRRRGRTNASKE
eukprot:gb/GEZN01005215.1/.p1 GENE.gb/GEZN01005215.1/~~gb/GEZN01005215.1/.p1  ORF type:complete len:411 (-),score=54.10 gb/GEZN01005215.1/:585-1817(-)